MNEKQSIRAAKNKLLMRNVRKFMRNKMAMAGLIVILLMVLACICAPFLTKYDAQHIDMSIRSLPASLEHPLGTDNMGRDMWARILYGGQMTMFIGVAGAVGSTALGTILGCMAGYLGKKFDAVIVYISELFMSFPYYLLVLLLVGIMGRSVTGMLMIFTFTGWTRIMRVVRTNVMSIREEGYVESCVANGISKWSIMFHHILPNTVGPIIVNITLSTASYILAEASLSFLGMGVPDTVTTWGTILNSAKRLDIIQNTPILWVAPGICICLFVLSINFFGDGLRDVLDPNSI